MASGPYKDERRGTWSIQWFNGVKWCRTVVVKRRPNWKFGDSMPKTPPPEAKAALAEYVKKEEAARKRQGYHPDRSIAEFLQAYLDGYLIGRQPGSKKEAAKAVRVFLTWCETQGIKTLGAVTSEVCHRWIADRAATRAKLSGEPIKHATLTKERGLLMTAWSEGLKRGQTDSNPWVRTEVPGKPTKKKRGSWSREEYNQLLAVSAPWLRDFLIVGCHTGFRVKVLRLLEWRDIRWPADKDSLGTIVVRPELDKAGKGYEIPLHEVVHDVLARRFLHNHEGHEFVLASLKGRPMRSSNITDSAIIRACARAKLRRPDSPNHHCRRTFGRWAVLGELTGEPVPMFTVSRWLGHATIAMTQHYLDLSDQMSESFMKVKRPSDPSSSS